MNKELTISIISMNNSKDLCPCLESIYKYTKNISFDIYVIFYLCPNNFVEEIKCRFPKVKIVISDKIRGYGENHNLVLKNVNSSYCLVLNDDTQLTMPTFELLVQSFKLQKDADIFVPKILNSDGTLQSCGKSYYSFFDYLLAIFHVRQLNAKKNKYTTQENIFQTYNISGSCFVIKTQVLRDIGYFDERYFFCPEDIALSTLANRKGYKVYANNNIYIYHHHGKTSSKIKYATYPAMRKGEAIFFADGNKFLLLFLSIMIFVSCLISLSINFFLYRDTKNVSYRAFINTCSTIFSSLTPKDIFVKYFTK